MVRKNTSMTKTAVGLVGGAALLVAGLVGCSSTPSAPKVTVDGQSKNVQGMAVCKPIRGGQGFEVSIATDKAPRDVSVELAKDASAVWFVTIGHFQGNTELHWLEHVTTYGNVSATKDGNDYKVTGNIAPANGASSNTYPFEIDFSCP